MPMFAVVESHSLDSDLALAPSVGTRFYPLICEGKRRRGDAACRTNQAENRKELMLVALNKN
jgi:hypothetical protein